MRPLFEMIIKAVPAPPGNLELPFLMQATTLTYDEYVGRQACGRILEGKIKKGDIVTRSIKMAIRPNIKCQRIEGYHGLKKVEMEEAGVGDIVSISGIPEITIGDTLCDPDSHRPAPSHSHSPSLPSRSRSWSITAHLSVKTASTSR